MPRKSFGERYGMFGKIFSESPQEGGLGIGGGGSDQSHELGSVIEREPISAAEYAAFKQRLFPQMRDLQQEVVKRAEGSDLYEKLAPGKDRQVNYRRSFWVSNDQLDGYNQFRRTYRDLLHYFARINKKLNDDPQSLTQSDLDEAERIYGLVERNAGRIFAATKEPTVITADQWKNVSAHERVDMSVPAQPVIDAEGISPEEASGDIQGTSAGEASPVSAEHKTVNEDTVHEVPYQVQTGPLPEDLKIGWGKFGRSETVEPETPIAIAGDKQALEVAVDSSVMAESVTKPVDGEQTLNEFWKMVDKAAEQKERAVAEKLRALEQLKQQRSQRLKRFGLAVLFALYPYALGNGDVTKAEAVMATEPVAMTKAPTEALAAAERSVQDIATAVQVNNLKAQAIAQIDRSPDTMLTPPPMPSAEPTIESSTAASEVLTAMPQVTAETAPTPTEIVTPDTDEALTTMTPEPLDVQSVDQATVPSVEQTDLYTIKTNDNLWHYEEGKVLGGHLSAVLEKVVPAYRNEVLSLLRRDLIRDAKLRAEVGIRKHPDLIYPGDTLNGTALDQRMKTIIARNNIPTQP